MPDIPRKPLWGWAVLTGIGAVYLAAIVLLLVLMWDMRRDISNVTNRLPAAMLEFERAIGYGGLIHNFKNQVLRPEEESYGIAALSDYTAAKKALDEFEGFAARSGVQVRTEEIRDTLDTYRDKITQVYEAHAAGNAPRRIDTEVRVSDTKALADLRETHDMIKIALAREIDHRRAQITIMIGVISLLMVLLPAGACFMLWLQRREERSFVDRIQALNSGLDSQNERLVATNHALSVSNAELSEFTHAAAHDLRTPLHGISHETEYLLEEFGDDMDQEVREKLVHIGALCQRLDMVMTLLLRYARLAPPSRMNVVEPLGVIRDLEVSFGPRLGSMGGIINVETELPPIHCKRFDLGMVFQKLIDNALTYNHSTQKDVAVGFLPRVEIEGEVLNDVFYVRDNGIGISPEYHDEVFRMFKRLHHDEAYGPRAGAGLSFVKKVVANYGGIVCLTSEPGKGTTVYFSFHRQTAQAKEVAGVPSTQKIRFLSAGA